MIRVAWISDEIHKWKVELNTMEGPAIPLVFRIDRHSSVTPQNIPSICKGKDAVVIHCNRRNERRISNLIQRIRQADPNIAVGLEGGCKSSLKRLGDFHITEKPLFNDEIESMAEEIRDAVEKRRK